MIQVGEVIIRATVSVVSIRADSVVVRSSTAVAALKILAQQTIVALNAAINAPEIVLGVQAQFMKASALTGWFLKFQQVADAAVLNDATAFRIQRALVELTNLADTAAVTAGKTFNDGFGITEAQVAEVIKGLTETLGLTDVAIRGVFKGLTDTPVAADVYASRFSTSRADQYQYREGPGIDEYAIDYFAEDYGYDGKPAIKFTKGAADSASMTDASVRMANKGLTETPVFADTLARYMARTLTEGITATDDFMGVANPDDDEVMTLKKPFIDVCTFGDTFARVVYFTRAFSDSASFADSTVDVFGKGLNDAGAFTDGLTDRFSKALTDSSIFSDAAGKYFSRGVADSSTFFDASVRSANKGLTDSAGFADSTITRSGKGLTDTATWTDNKAFAMAKPMADAGTVAESAAKSFNPAKADSASFTDNGSLRMQSYSDFSYFAADYVGTYQTF